MTVKEAIENLKAILEEATETEDAVSYVTSVDAESLNLAISALEKQIPQKAQKDLQPTCNNLATDTISRQAAIDAIKTSRYLVDAMEKIIRLPSAQPERKTAEWEIYVISMLDGEGCRCSECGFEGAPYWDFCPGCGADMRGEQDDERTGNTKP